MQNFLKRIQQRVRYLAKLILAIDPNYVINLKIQRADSMDEGGVDSVSLQSAFSDLHFPNIHVSEEPGLSKTQLLNLEGSAMPAVNISQTTTTIQSSSPQLLITEPSFLEDKFFNEKTRFSRLSAHLIQQNLLLSTEQDSPERNRSPSPLWIPGETSTFAEVVRSGSVSRNASRSTSPEKLLGEQTFIKLSQLEKNKNVTECTAKPSTNVRTEFNTPGSSEVLNFGTAPDSLERRPANSKHSKKKGKSVQSRVEIPGKMKVEKKTDQIGELCSEPVEIESTQSVISPLKEEKHVEQLEKIKPITTVTEKKESKKPDVGNPNACIKSIKSTTAAVVSDTEGTLNQQLAGLNLSDILPEEKSEKTESFGKIPNSISLLDKTNANKKKKSDEVANDEVKTVDTPVAEKNISDVPTDGKSGKKKSFKIIETKPDTSLKDTRVSKEQKSSKAKLKTHFSEVTSDTKNIKEKREGQSDETKPVFKHENTKTESKKEENLNYDTSDMVNIPDLKDQDSRCEYLKGNTKETISPSSAIIETVSSEKTINPEYEEYYEAGKLIRRTIIKKTVIRTKKITKTSSGEIVIQNEEPIVTFDEEISAEPISYNNQLNTQIIELPSTENNETEITENKKSIDIAEMKISEDKDMTIGEAQPKKSNSDLTEIIKSSELLISHPENPEQKSAETFHETKSHLPVTSDHVMKTNKKQKSKKSKSSGLQNIPCDSNLKNDVTSDTNVIHDDNSISEIKKDELNAASSTPKKNKEVVSPISEQVDQTIRLTEVINEPKLSHLEGPVEDNNPIKNRSKSKKKTKRVEENNSVETTASDKSQLNDDMNNFPPNSEIHDNFLHAKPIGIPVSPNLSSELVMAPNSSKDKSELIHIQKNIEKSLNENNEPLIVNRPISSDLVLNDDNLNQEILSKKGKSTEKYGSKKENSAVNPSTGVQDSVEVTTSLSTIDRSFVDDFVHNERTFDRPVSPLSHLIESDENVPSVTQSVREDLANSKNFSSPNAFEKSEIISSEEKCSTKSTKSSKKQKSNKKLEKSVSLSEENLKIELKPHKVEQEYLQKDTVQSIQTQEASDKNSKKIKKHVLKESKSSPLINIKLDNKLDSSDRCEQMALHPGKVNNEELTTSDTNVCLKLDSLDINQITEPPEFIKSDEKLNSTINSEIANIPTNYEKLEGGDDLSNVKQVLSADTINEISSSEKNSGLIKEIHVSDNSTDICPHVEFEKNNANFNQITIPQPDKIDTQELHEIPSTTHGETDNSVCKKIMSKTNKSSKRQKQKKVDISCADGIISSPLALKKTEKVEVSDFIPETSLTITEVNLVPKQVIAEEKNSPSESIILQDQISFTIKDQPQKSKSNKKQQKDKNLGTNSFGITETYVKPAANILECGQLVTSDLASGLISEMIPSSEGPFEKDSVKHEIRKESKIVRSAEKKDVKAATELLFMDSIKGDFDSGKMAHVSKKLIIQDVETTEDNPTVLISSQYDLHSKPKATEYLENDPIIEPEDMLKTSSIDNVSQNIQNTLGHASVDEMHKEHSHTQKKKSKKSKIRDNLEEDITKKKSTLKTTEKDLKRAKSGSSHMSHTGSNIGVNDDFQCGKEILLRKEKLIEETEPYLDIPVQTVSDDITDENLSKIMEVKAPQKSDVTILAPESKSSVEENKSITNTEVFLEKEKVKFDKPKVVKKSKAETLQRSESPVKFVETTVEDDDDDDIIIETENKESIEFLPENIEKVKNQPVFDKNEPTFSNPEVEKFIKPIDSETIIHSENSVNDPDSSEYTIHNPTITNISYYKEEPLRATVAYGKFPPENVCSHVSEHVASNITSENLKRKKKNKKHEKSTSFTESMMNKSNAPFSDTENDGVITSALPNENEPFGIIGTIKSCQNIESNLVPSETTSFINVEEDTEIISDAKPKKSVSFGEKSNLMEPVVDQIHELETSKLIDYKHSENQTISAAIEYPQLDESSLSQKIDFPPKQSKQKKKDKKCKTNKVSPVQLPSTENCNRVIHTTIAEESKPGNLIKTITKTIVNPSLEEVSNPASVLVSTPISTKKNKITKELEVDDSFSKSDLHQLDDEPSVIQSQVLPDNSANERQLPSSKFSDEVSSSSTVNLTLSCDEKDEQIKRKKGNQRTKFTRPEYIRKVEPEITEKDCEPVSKAISVGGIAEDVASTSKISPVPESVQIKETAEEPIGAKNMNKSSSLEPNEITCVETSKFLNDDINIKSASNQPEIEFPKVEIDENKIKSEKSDKLDCKVSEGLVKSDLSEPVCTPILAKKGSKKKKAEKSTKGVLERPAEFPSDDNPEKVDISVQRNIPKQVITSDALIFSEIKEKDLTLSIPSTSSITVEEICNITEENIGKEKKTEKFTTVADFNKLVDHPNADFCQEETVPSIIDCKNDLFTKTTAMVDKNSTEIMVDVCPGQFSSVSVEDVNMKKNKKKKDGKATEQSLIQPNKPEKEDISITSDATDYSIKPGAITFTESKKNKKSAKATEQSFIQPNEFAKDDAGITSDRTDNSVKPFTESKKKKKTGKAIKSSFIPQTEPMKEGYGIIIPLETEEPDCSVNNIPTSITESSKSIKSDFVEKVSPCVDCKSEIISEMKRNDGKVEISPSVVTQTVTPCKDNQNNEVTVPRAKSKTGHIRHSVVTSGRIPSIQKESDLSPSGVGKLVTSESTQPATTDSSFDEMNLKFTVSKEKLLNNSVLKSKRDLKKRKVKQDTNQSSNTDTEIVDPVADSQQLPLKQMSSEGITPDNVILEAQRSGIFGSVMEKHYWVPENEHVKQNLAQQTALKRELENIFSGVEKMADKPVFRNLSFFEDDQKPLEIPESASFETEIVDSQNRDSSEVPSNISFIEKVTQKPHYIVRPTGEVIRELNDESKSFPSELASSSTLTDEQRLKLWFIENKHSQVPSNLSPISISEANDHPTVWFANKDKEKSGFQQQICNVFQKPKILESHEGSDSSKLVRPNSSTLEDSLNDDNLHSTRSGKKSPAEEYLKKKV